ncbi:Lysophospholipase L1 [Pedobacter sp. ok626]|uniref:rhamnogalacturonan acetylesterase n=1 Tax=Pedobacter sp. ok626 TaxID=1761882 RepID=UPI00087F128A|nr:rhamnogalacturonan acetylesterase [Pedobacter sp. ok626]SDL65447.1 Lysophospholipase L1 [Pedobacter sp. ok626]
MKIRQFISVFSLCMLSLSSLLAQPVNYRFDFGEGVPAKGYLKILPEDKYTSEKGFGFISGTELVSVTRHGKDILRTDYITSKQPFYFSVDIPDGDYNVTVYLGDEEGTSSQTIRVECRRLMVHQLATPEKMVVAKQFTVHKRSVVINGKEKVLIKESEKDYLHWDNQLTFEFNGTNPKICGLVIEKTAKPITVFLAGNSTVVDQVREPWAAWGQMIPSFFVPGKVVVANYGESGETLKAFQREKRLDKIWSMAKKGDYLFIEFAHNDQKSGINFVDPFTSYTAMLKEYIAEARKRGIHPVLVTSMLRRNFDDQGKIVNTLGDYPEAMRRCGKEMGVTVIDLNAMSRVLYETWGPKESLKAFVHYPANTFPGVARELKDDTHFNPYGAYMLARCVASGITDQHLGISKYLKEKFRHFDPSKPDLPDSFVWPLSPQVGALKPEGN